MMPEGETLRGTRFQKVDNETQTPQECFVDIVLAIRGENGNTVKLLHPLKQVIYFNIGEPVVGIFDLRALSEERVCFIEEKQNISALARIKHLLQALLSFSDILVHNSCEIDAIEFQSKRSSQHLRGHRLAGAARSR